MFFLIHKPLGLSSFSAIAHLRKKFGIKKVGHTGTLDPLATGLLLVATDNSTKLIPYIDKARKTYVFTVRLDGSTPSYDLDTPVEYLDAELVQKVGKQLKKEDIEKILQTDFSGKITQVPPAYSALRIKGQRAYDMVRAGQEVTISKREVEIFSSKIVSFSFPEVTIEMEVSVGTYIRSIARDIGEKLGLAGYVTMLHRSKIEHLREDISSRIEDISLENSLSYEIVFPKFWVVSPSVEVLEDIRNGIVFENTLGLESGKKYLVENNPLTHKIHFSDISNSSEPAELNHPEYSGLGFGHDLGSSEIQEDRKTLSSGRKYISLIEEREGKVRILANNIQ